jgi:hypothetical protein
MNAVRRAKRTSGGHGNAAHIEARVAFGLRKPCYAVGPVAKTETLYRFFDRHDCAARTSHKRTPSSPSGAHDRDHGYERARGCARSSSGCPSCCGAPRARRRGGRQSRWAPVCSSWPWACPGSRTRPLSRSAPVTSTCLRPGTGGIRQRPGSPWQLRRLLRLGHRVDPIPAPLGGMAGHRKRSGARTHPHQLD